ncbi:MAG: deoxyuridine 5'-triphosphate nucleotidohydrolase [Firmicutes bacterium]|nr:deoxyuridine 5'-triphosphate nucleotidohydrolase [Bacillota bacterium]
MNNEYPLIHQLVKELSAACYYEIVSAKTLDQIGVAGEDIKLPYIATGSSAGADFYTPVPIDLNPGEEMTVPTGIKAHQAPFVYLQIVPKSGLGFKYYTRLANTVGIVDGDYYDNPSNEGCIFVKIRNEGDKPLHIEKGKAFCQGIFSLYIPDRDYFNREHERRLGGFGSTEEK